MIQNLVYFSKTPIGYFKHPSFWDIIDMLNLQALAPIRENTQRYFAAVSRSLSGNLDDVQGWIGKFDEVFVKASLKSTNVIPKIFIVC